MPPDQTPRSLLDQCWQCIREGSADEALRHANDAVAAFERSGDTVGQADAARAVVNAMVKLGQVSEAATAAKERLLGIRRSGEMSLEVLRRREAPLLLAAAEVHLAANEPEKANTSALQAQRFFQGVNAQQGAAEAQLVMARAHLMQSSTKETLSAAEAAAAQFRALGDRVGEASALEAAVEANFSAARYAEVVKSAEAAQQVLSDSDDKAGLARMLQWKARAQLKSNDSEEALSSARRSMQLFFGGGVQD
mmetsp:Transcript_7628/g.18236  ORF Transcript_7628/g.18236 Transcript_7628/m.18236 type:complete len:251 (-) Transcript_7628:715-1467(-)